MERQVTCSAKMGKEGKRPVSLFSAIVVMISKWALLFWESILNYHIDTYIYIYILTCKVLTYAWAERSLDAREGTSGSIRSCQRNWRSG